MASRGNQGLSGDFDEDRDYDRIPHVNEARQILANWQHDGDWDGVPLWRLMALWGVAPTQPAI